MLEVSADDRTPMQALPFSSADNHYYGYHEQEPERERQVHRFFLWVPLERERALALSLPMEYQI